MISIYIDEKYRKFVRKGDNYATGAFFIGDTLIRNENVLDDIEHVSERAQIEKALRKYNGFYALIINRGHECFAVVDRMRSIPIFYGKKDNNLIISNNAEWVRQQVGDKELNPEAEQEFLAVGYVTGRDTLYENVKQLQAGEYLCFSTDKGEVITNRYYRFLHKEPDIPSSKEEYQNELDEVVNSAIKRLIEYANGRQIVVPLSAGRDSRLIALKLKQLDYQNVLCFTYGVKGNFEAETSRKVAHTLGFRWEYIEYTKESWKVWFNSPERKAYYEMACRYTSLPGRQIWPAVWELKKRRLFEQDALFVPGHCDLFAGSKTHSDACSDRSASIDDVICKILEENYHSLSWRGSVEDEKKRWQERILEACEVSHITNRAEYADVCEKWNWQERQTKYIVNTVTYFEFWGYDWWLPLCDADYLSYWEKIPVKYRVERKMYRDYVDSLYLSFTKRTDQHETHKMKRIIMALLRKTHCYDFLSLIYKKLFYSVLNRPKSEFCSTNMDLWALPNDFILQNSKIANNAWGLFTIDIVNEIKNGNE